MGQQWNVEENDDSGLVQTAETFYRSWWNFGDDYHLSEPVCRHLAEGGCMSELVSLLSGFRWTEVRVRSGDLRYRAISRLMTQRQSVGHNIRASRCSENSSSFLSRCLRSGASAHGVFLKRLRRRVGVTPMSLREVVKTYTFTHRYQLYRVLRLLRVEGSSDDKILRLHFKWLRSSHNEQFANVPLTVGFIIH